jgi:hypothetical protein
MQTQTIGSRRSSRATLLVVLVALAIATAIVALEARAIWSSTVTHSTSTTGQISTPDLGDTFGHRKVH